MKETYVFCDHNQVVIGALQKELKEKPNVEFVVGNIFDLVHKVDAIVAPGNSFGYMDGGLDGAIVNWFMGWKDIQDLVYSYIHTNHGEELPVGHAGIIEIGDKGFPFLIYAPTMRGPMDISGTDNVHLAMGAVIKAVDSHNGIKGSRKIRRIAVSGLGTGVGLMKPETSALQVRQAFEERS